MLSYLHNVYLSLSLSLAFLFSSFPLHLPLFSLFASASKCGVEDAVVSPSVIVDRNLESYKTKYIASFHRNDVNWDENVCQKDTWSARKVMVYTNLGNVIMQYDPKNEWFAYYCDNRISPSVLNFVAMKYVILFRCRKFYLGAEAEAEAEAGARAGAEAEVAEKEKEKEKGAWAGAGAAEKEKQKEKETIVYQKYKHRVCRDMVQKNKYKYYGKLFEASFIQPARKAAFDINVLYDDPVKGSHQGRYLDYLKKNGGGAAFR